LQVHFRYPQKNLNGRAIKSAIAAHLVAPVLTSGDRVHAFRVVWRVSDNSLAHAWDAIVSLRHLCDDVVAKTPSLQMFVSCISGVFTNAVAAGSTRASPEKPIYPAVSYWVVLDESRASSFGELFYRIVAVCPSVQVKHIKSLRCSQIEEPLPVECGTLFVTLKDHNSRFVHQKITRSLLAAGVAHVSSQPVNAKLLLMPRSKYVQQIPAAVEVTKASGLSIELEVIDGNVVE